MPPKAKTAQILNLYPKITSTLILKWDVNKPGKIVLFDAKETLVLLGFSTVAVHSKYDTKVGGQDLTVRSTSTLCAS